MLAAAARMLSVDAFSKAGWSNGTNSKAGWELCWELMVTVALAPMTHLSCSTELADQPSSAVNSAIETFGSSPSACCAASGTG